MEIDTVFLGQNQNNAGSRAVSLVHSKCANTKSYLLHIVVPRAEVTKRQELDL